MHTYRVVRANSSDELYHYGILGMKWGVRRFQNKDGTRTQAGKERYYKTVPKKAASTKERVKNFYEKEVPKKAEELFHKNFPTEEAIRKERDTFLRISELDRILNDDIRDDEGPRKEKIENKIWELKQNYKSYIVESKITQELLKEAEAIDPDFDPLGLHSLDHGDQIWNIVDDVFVENIVEPAFEEKDEWFKNNREWFDSF